MVELWVGVDVRLTSLGYSETHRRLSVGQEGYSAFDWVVNSGKWSNLKYVLRENHRS